MSCCQPGTSFPCCACTESALESSEAGLVACSDLLTCLPGLCRLTESEATLQHQLAWAQQQIAGAAAPGLFDVTVQDDSPKAAYVGLQEAVAPLSPAVRHKLQGLPADLLDYADLIASSSVEQPILKPVLVAGERCLFAYKAAQAHWLPLPQNMHHELTLVMPSY